MAEIEAAVFARLSTDSGVTPLLGSGSSARIYPGQAPQASVWPVLVYQKAHQQYLRTLVGRLRTNTYSMRLTVAGDDFDAVEVWIFSR